MTNASEKAFEAQARQRGFEPIRTGWPDFLVVSPDKSYVFCVEVKTQGDGLKGNQRRVKNLLESMGLAVIISEDGIWTEPNDAQKHRVQVSIQAQSIIESHTVKDAENRTLRERLAEFEKRDKERKDTIRASTKSPNSPGKDDGMLLAVSLRVLRGEISEDEAVSIMKERQGGLNDS